MGGGSIGMKGLEYILENITHDHYLRTPRLQNSGHFLIASFPLCTPVSLDFVQIDLRGIREKLQMLRYAL